MQCLLNAESTRWIYYVNINEQKKKNKLKNTLLKIKQNIQGI